MEDLPDTWREILSGRSVRDKIAVPINCAIAPVELLPVVAELVRDGYMTWLDRATLPMAAILSDGNVIIGVACDIYLLTPKGTALCDKHGIAQK